MRYLFILALFIVLLMPQPAYAAGCGEGHAYDGSGARIQTACFVVESSVHGYACPTLYQDDGMGRGTATAQQAAEHTARIVCVEAYEASQGVLHSGNFSPDGVDPAFSVRPSEVKILSVEKRH